LVRYFRHLAGATELVAEREAQTELLGRKRSSGMELVFSETLVSASLRALKPPPLIVVKSAPTCL